MNMVSKIALAVGVLVLATGFAQAEDRTFKIW